MTALKERILRLIGSQGPISIAQYMQIALGDPEAGYYMRRDPIGQAGDFITAPEVSQIFGELIGLCLVQAWEDRGRPERLHLVELGPGRGTLMADILRASRIRPAFREAARITMVETSPTLRREQARALTGMEARWATNITEIADDAPLFLIANEFFDVLPIRQFVRGPRGWHERMVAAEGDKLIFAMTPDTVPTSAIPERLRDAPAGSIVEINPAAQAVAGEIGARIAAHGGVAIIVDYGYSQAAIGETFQAVRKQFFADPLAEPGEADLTAHVDFGALADAAREAGAVACGPVPQGYLLEQLGIGARAEALKLADPYEAADIDSGVARLTKSRQMGTLFKALAICDRAPPGVPGFPC